MGFATPGQKEDIRNRVALEELVRDYNIVLRPSGRRLKGLCPFHSEKTPSFTVDGEKQYFYCFGCQEKGDVFDFVQKMDRLDFGAAVEVLAQRAGVVLEQRPGGRGDSSSGGSLNEVYDALVRARDFYHHTLLRDPAAAPARDYLARRGIGEEMWGRFALGFAPAGGNTLLRRAVAQGVTVEVLERAGLVRRREGRGGGSSANSQESSCYDMFWGRLMFPIHDTRGRVLGFGGRTLGDDVPKYVNTSKTAVFDKSQILYGLGGPSVVSPSGARVRGGGTMRAIEKAGCVAVVEGYTDVIIAHQAGLEFTVASLGTAFTAENARRLGRIAPRVLVVFDGDAAGQKAAERSLDLLVGESLDVSVYTVTGGQDPADAILEQGGEEFLRRAQKDSVGLFEYKWKCTMEAGELDDAGPALKARALDEFLALLAKVPNVVARKLHVREFAERLGVDESDLEARLRSMRSPRYSPRQEAGQRLSQRAETGKNDEDALNREGEIEDVVLECLLALPQRAAEILAQVSADFFRGSTRVALVEAIERQLKEGEYTPQHLLRAMEDREIHQQLLEVLSRLENPDGSSTRNYEEVWRLAQRDIERQSVSRQVEELKGFMTEARKNGETTKLPQYEREYFETVRKLKRQRKPELARGES